MEFVGGTVQLNLYKPTLYNPAGHELKYPETPTTTIINGKEGSFFLGTGTGIAVDPADDHLFVDVEKHISEYSSEAEGNKLLDATIGEGVLDDSRRVAVDGVRRRLYVSDALAPTHSPDVIRVFEADPPYKELETLDGSNVPAGKFQTIAGAQSIAVDEATGDFFVDDIGGSNKEIYQFDKEYKYLFSYTHGFEAFLPEIEVDNSSASPNAGTLFVPSVKEGAHVYAFKPKLVSPPKVEKTSVAEVTEDEAEFHARINPEGLETEYRLEYVTQQAFEEGGFSEALVAGEDTLPVAKVGIEVSAVASGLEPGVSYRFRAFAENEEGSGAGEASFTTYEAAEAPPPCENDPLRIGPSAGLPDCRAYELVTPPSTGGRLVRGRGFAGNLFLTRETSPSGDKVSFVTWGGSIPGTGGTGAFGGEPYLSTRGTNGWTTTNAGPNGSESEAPLAGSISSDQAYSFWATIGYPDQGSKVIDEKMTRYVRYPNGDSELVGRGGLGTDPRADGKFISENGSHIIFGTAASLGVVPQQLEPNAPPEGIGAVYDRTADEVTHVVSLLPGDVTPASSASYVGSSPDGSGIAFGVGGTLYLRLDDEETYEIGKGVTFAGMAEGRSRIFYVEGGDLFAFDAETEERIPFTENGDATAVNVSADGTAAYFASPSVLTGEENPNGAVAQAGEQNLYLSEEGSIRFVGTVTDRDIEGSLELTEGLGLWTYAVGSSNLARDPSRTTPDGGVLLFESRADLAGYDPEGHVEIYRYDSVGNELSCLSCAPTRLAATGDASLQTVSTGRGEPLNAFGYVPNLRSDGRRAFFQSSEALVLGDVDGLLDVYEWEADGVGSCKEEGGCVYLVSSGHSSNDDFLFAVSDSGDNVFFRTWDLLTKFDAEAATSVYDARVGGGFPETPPQICEGEGCRPQLTPPPPIPAPESAVQGDGGNVTAPQGKPCPKHKRRVKRHGKVRCVPRHHKRNHK
jgi:hypothetical protein